MAQKLTSAQKGELADQLAELYRLASNGTRGYGAVRRGVQDIIEGKLVSPSTGPTGWYVQPRDQVAEMARLITDHPEWGFTTGDIPVIPDDFAPATPTEALLLVLELPDADGVGGVQRTFDEVWSLVPAPAGFSTWRWPDLKSDPDHLRLVDGKQHQPGLRWIGFDPFVGWNRQSGQRVDHLWASANPASLAGPEALWAAVLFPGWTASMDGTKVPYADLAAYQFNWDNASTPWSRCPCLDRWVGARRLELRADWAVLALPGWAAPRVRELAA